MWPSGRAREFGQHDGAGRAGPVQHGDGLAQQRLGGAGDGALRHVEGAAGGEGAEEGDGPLRRPARLRACDPRGGQGAEGECGQVAAARDHVQPPGGIAPASCAGRGGKGKQMRHGIVVGVDIGGTFTDLVALDTETRRVVSA